MASHFTYPTHYLDTEIVAHARPIRLRITGR